MLRRCCVLFLKIRRRFFHSGATPHGTRTPLSNENSPAPRRRGEFRDVLSQSCISQSISSTRCYSAISLRPYLAGTFPLNTQQRCYLMSAAVNVHHDAFAIDLNDEPDGENEKESISRMPVCVCTRAHTYAHSALPKLLSTPKRSVRRCRRQAPPPPPPLPPLRCDANGMNLIRVIIVALLAARI